MTAHTSRLLMYLASQKQPPVLVPPHKPTRIIGRADNGAFALSRLYICNAGTARGAADWVVNDIEVDGKSQLTQKDLPGALFSSQGVAAAKRASTVLSLCGFDPVERGCELALTVTYVGSRPEGAAFFAALEGARPPQRPTVVLIETLTEFPPKTLTTISALVENAPFQIDRIEIDEGWDWLVHDLRINGRPQFAQPGDIPGDMFSTEEIGTLVPMETCRAGGTIEIDATYIGLAVCGLLTGCLRGTVVRDDYSTPPRPRAGHCRFQAGTVRGRSLIAH